MNFEVSPEIAALGDLAEQIFSSATSIPAIEAIESRGAGEWRVDGDLWRHVAETGLLDAALSEESGGLGLGMVGMAVVLEAHGRSASPMPLVDAMVAARVIERCGTSALQQAVLPLGGAVDPSTVPTIALENFGVNDPSRSSVQAHRAETGEGLVLSGSKPAVHLGGRSARIVVSVQADDELTMAVVDTDASGVTVTTHETTTREHEHTISFDDVLVNDSHVFGTATDVAWAAQQYRVGTAAYVLGSCEQAIAYTVDHGNSREQFGKPLSHNQAYSQRMASAAIDVDCLRVSVLQAAWLLDENLDADDEVLMAAWWASDAGLRVVHSAQHLHGGSGADVTSGVHRHFLAVKQRAHALGTASSHLADLGARIAADLVMRN